MTRNGEHISLSTYLQRSSKTVLGILEEEEGYNGESLSIESTSFSDAISQVLSSNKERAWVGA